MENRFSCCPMSHILSITFKVKVYKVLFGVILPGDHTLKLISDNIKVSCWILLLGLIVN